MASIYEDNTNGTIRVVLHENDLVQAVFFAARAPVILSRAAAVSSVGTPTASLHALAGRMGQDQPDPGIVVCACFNVGENTLLRAVGEGAQSVQALGEMTSAGTNCGSCKPELARLVAQNLMPVAAE
jgi:assimilatory nitrate reductase catalytic subunit